MTRAKLFLFCVFSLPLLAQRGVISGTVIEASSGDPVRKAIVTATWHGTPRSWATTRTDGSGQFIFEGLPAGKYDLRATKTGLGTAIYGANSVRELGDMITLADGETHADIKLRFLRSSTISGTVLDPDGDPVAGASVTLLRANYNQAERTLMNGPGTNTNDRGEYKITAVDAGLYYLRCLPNMPRYMGEPIARDIVIPQYYGGARESKDAAPLNLRGGEVLAGIDFHLIAEHPATISGRVTGVPQLDLPTDEHQQIRPGVIIRNGGRFNPGGGPGFSVSMTPAEPNQMGFGGQGAGVNGPDYRFNLADATPGRYRVESTIRAKNKSYYASEIVDAHEGINDIVLAMVPGGDVKGHLKVEGPGAHPVESFAITLSSDGSLSRLGTYSSSVKKDGSFSIEDVPPGEWLLNINPTPKGIFEKFVHLGDKDFLYQRLEIPPGSDAPLNIVISSNTATVSGEVDTGGAEGKLAGILLEPLGNRHNRGVFYYSATADDNGKFKLEGVAPGKYKIFALEKIATTNYRNPESGDLLDALGEELDVPEGAKVESHPKLIPQEKAKEILKP